MKEPFGGRECEGGGGGVCGCCGDGLQLEVMDIESLQRG